MEVVVENKRMPFSVLLCQTMDLLLQPPELTEESERRPEVEFGVCAVSAFYHES